MGNQNPAIREAVVVWLQKNPDGLGRLEAAGIKPGEYMSKIISGDSFSERVMFMSADRFEFVTGINLRDTMLMGARINLWGNDRKDHLPEIVSHSDLQKALVAASEQRGVTNLSRSIGLGSPGALYKWTHGSKARIYTEWLERILRTLNDPNHVAPPNVRERQSSRPKQKRGQPRRSKDIGRAVIGATISVLNNQINVLKAVTQGNNFLCEGDKMNIVSIVTRLLVTCGIDNAFVEQSGQVTPIDKGTKRLLSGFLS